MKAQLLNQPEDYKKLGINMERVEPWEDGRRYDDNIGSAEWWYFDAVMDDGTRVGLNFSTNHQNSVKEKGYHPFLYINVQLPDGKVVQDAMFYGKDDISFGNEGCDVKIGQHQIKGNLKEYTIHVEPVHGIGVDLKMVSTSKPWRPGTAYFTFGEGNEEDKFFTWLCAMPKGNVTGTITANGETKAVNGVGYHDHQWGSTDHVYVWNHWLWARQHTEDYSVLMFDFVARKEYGYKRFPVFCLQDKNGNIIFENTDHVKYEVLEEYMQESSQKLHPKISRYTFEHDGKKVEYTLTANDEIVVANHYANAPEATKNEYDQMGIKPTYTRYAATGELVITDGSQIIRSKGELMYEFSYYDMSYNVEESC